METNESRMILNYSASVPLSALTGIGKVLEKLGRVTALLPEDLTIIRSERTTRPWSSPVPIQAAKPWC